MYIKNTQVADPDHPVRTKRLRSEATLGETVEFDLETGRARVRADVGESLAEAFDAIEIVSREGAD